MAESGIEEALHPFREAIAEGVKAVMTGHLLVPSYDAERPATLSTKVLTGLLREELGFDGMIITDGIEMAAVSGAYGIGGASARAIAAGADAICVGGENFDEATVIGIREAIAAAVAEGLLPEERLADAARRVRELAAWAASSGSPAPADGRIGLVAARRAIRVTRRSTAPVLPLMGVPHVVELSPEMNLAIDRNTPWGVGRPLSVLIPGTTVTRLTVAQATGPELERLIIEATGHPLVVVVRDVHRHAWQSEALRHLLSARPDAVVVEMGLPARSDLGSVHVATYGSARVCGQAAAEVLTGSL
ncbi:glycoside hydrolase family 3 N-terminal domain-containing protein [Nonomuraea antimicrobica]